MSEDIIKHAMTCATILLCVMNIGRAWVLIVKMIANESEAAGE